MDLLKRLQLISGCRLDKNSSTCAKRCLRPYWKPLCPRTVVTSGMINALKVNLPFTIIDTRKNSWLGGAICVRARDNLKLWILRLICVWGCGCLVHTGPSLPAHNDWKLRKQRAIMEKHSEDMKGCTCNEQVTALFSNYLLHHWHMQKPLETYFIHYCFCLRRERLKCVC